MASSDGRSWPRALGISLMLMAVALAARFAVVAFIHQPSTYLTYYPVVVAAAIWAGWRGAAISLALSMALVFGLVGVEAPGADWIDLSIRSAIFLAGAGFIAWTGVILRETLRKLRAVMSQEREEHAALQTSEQRMRLAQDVAGFGVFDWNIETGEAYLSEGFLKNWGVTREVATDREVLLQRVHPDDRAMVRASNDAALASGRVYEAEYRIIRDSDGAERWLYVRGEVQLGPDGKARRTIGVNQDVTARKRAEATLRESEAALRESEERFRAMADSAPAPIWVTGPEGGIEFVNMAMLDFFAAERGALVGDGWRDRIHPDDLQPMLDGRVEARSRHLAYDFEARFRNATGQWRGVRAYSQPRFAADGAFVGYVGIAFDITEIRESQAALSEREQQLRAMFDQAAAGMARTDLNGRIEMVNERFARMLAAEPADLVGRSVKELTWPEDQTESEERFSQLREAGKPYAAAKRYRRADGSPVWASASVSPMVNAEGAVTGAVAVIIDLTETRKAEAALRESEQRFRLIADSAPVPMWVSRPGGAREFVNKAYADYLEVSYEEALAEDWRDLIHPDDGPRIRAEQIAGEASRKPFTLEARYRRADGEWRWLRSFSQPRFGPDGEHIGFIGVAFDVTEAKQAAQDLQHINDLLAERVDAALEQKAQAEAALAHAQKIEAVGRLTGGVAHDFNNLLTVVIGALDMILKHPGDEKKRERMAEAAMAAARRGERLTHQLLAFSRRQALRPEVIDVNHLVRETEPLLRRAVGEQVGFEVSAAKPAVVRVDPGQFEATLLNLVVNARDATPAGGTIAIDSAVRDIEDGAPFESPPGRYLAVAVRDTGSGMPPDVAARAFEPFFTTKPVGKGTGLGLSQVYGFARQSGGGVTIESRPGEGATITVFLPVAEAGADAQPKPVPSPRRAGAALRVLLVEDDPAVGAIAETMLGDLGHTIERADAAAPALERLNSDAPFDLLLTDVIMPGGVNGVELAREAVKLRPGLQVLLTSGYAGDAIDEALSAAPWPFLKKPYAEAELAAVLQGMRRGAEVG